MSCLVANMSSHSLWWRRRASDVESGRLIEQRCSQRSGGRVLSRRRAATFLPRIELNSPDRGARSRRQNPRDHAVSISSVDMRAISNPSVSALKMPDQRLFSFGSATKSAISATSSRSSALSSLVVLRDVAEHSAHGALLRCLVSTASAWGRERESLRL